jgi:glycosyltransferase involved in cell wall biosynthesis
MDERSYEIEEVVRRDRVAITAVVAAYNEEADIGRCLTGLLSQEGVEGGIEIIVVDGNSTDRTADIVRSFPQFGTQIRLLQNPRRLQVYAWNMALREARGEYYAMILAHADYSTTYFKSCLDVMHRTGAAAVGGVQRPYGQGLVGRAIAWCMSSPFGMGNARYRYTHAEEETDSVFSIFTRRQTLEDLGGYDERVPFDEDSDLNYRLRARGGKLVVSPRIEVRYFVRRSLKALWKQMFRYGYWRRFTQLKHPGAVPLRVYAPAALVAALVFSAAFATTPLRLLAAVVPALYAAFLLLCAVLSVPRSGAAAIFVPCALATMHAAYGVGYWKALIKMRALPRGRHAHSPVR